MEAYKQIRNRINTLNIQLRRDYFSEKNHTISMDLKKTWKTINQVINKRSNTTVVPNLTVEGQTIKGNKEIASSLNEYFCSIGNKLSEKIPQKANPFLRGDYPFQDTPDGFSFSAIT